MLRFSSTVLASLAALAPSAVAQHHIYTVTDQFDTGSFGRSTSAIGDVDGDNVCDFVVANAGGASLGKDNNGLVHVISGRTGKFLLTVSGKNNKDAMGFVVSGIGDANKDGTPDFAVGAPSAPYTGRPAPGEVYVFSGKTGARLLVIQNPVPARQRFGEVVAAAGDVDNDGHADVIVGHRGASSYGAAYVFSGKHGGKILEATGIPLRPLGDAVSGIGDVDSDGHDDVVVAGSMGAVVISGRTRQQLFPLRYSPGGNFKVATSIADIDRDKIRDVVISDARLRNNFALGRVLVFSGKTGLQLYQIKSPSGWTSFGRSLSGIDDVNADGVPDLLIGDDRVSSAHYRGAAYVYSGKTGKLLETYVATGKDMLGRFQFGLSVSALGDVDGDGRPDFVGGGNGRVQVYSAARLDLSSPTHRVSIFEAGHQFLDIHGGKQRAGKLAFVLGSGSGISPGVKIGNGTLPLNPDAYFGFTIAAPFAVVYGNLTILDKDGNGRVAFRLPTGLPASLGGTVLHHSCLFLGPGIEPARNAVRVELTKF